VRMADEADAAGLFDGVDDWNASSAAGRSAARLGRWCLCRDGPETPKVRIGIIALTDCSSIVMAHELGLFK
jgi:ABC-type nitrate/sulfonate/bicarbonate transport system substrate-binding protein